MTIVGTTFVEVRAISNNLEKDIASAVEKASKQANSALKLKPTVDTGKAEQELGKVEQAVKKTASSGGLLQYAMNRVKTALHGVAEDGGPVAHEMSEAASALSGMAPAALAAGAGIAVVVGAAYLGVSSFSSLAEEVHRFQAISGATAEDASRFVVGLRVIGQNAQSVGQALFRMSREAAANGKALSDDGIVIARNSKGGLDLVDTFLNVADAYKSAGEGAGGAKVLFDAFGRQGATLAPILALDRKQLQDLFSEADKNHEVMSDADIQKALDYKIAVNEAKESIKGLGVEVGRPSINVFTSAVKLGTSVVRGWGNDLDGLGNLISHVGGHALAAKLGIDSMSNSEARAAQQAQDLAVQEVDLEKAVVGAAQAHIGLQQATASVTAADDAARNAEHEYQKLLRQGPVDAQAVASARRELTSANDSLTSANDRLTKAEAALAKVQLGASPRDKEKATLRVAEANNAVSRAQDDLAKLQRTGRASSLDLSDAQNRLAEANLEAGDAQDALNEVVAKGTDGAPDTIAAQDEVKQAQDGVTKATEDQQTATQNLHTALAGDPDFQYKLAAARDQVATSTANAAGAHLALETAALQAANAQDVLETALSNDAGAVSALLTAFQGIATAFHIPLTSLVGLLPGQQSYAPPRDTSGNLIPPSPVATPVTPKPPKRAAGGDVDAGYWYEINEQGTEYFKPSTNGTVIPIGHAADQHAAAAAGPSVQQNFNVYSSDPDRAAKLTSIYSARSLRTVSR